MKIATTIGDLYEYFDTPAEAVAFYEGTEFRFLDYNFRRVLLGDNPFLSDGWKKIILDAKNAAEARGYEFIQAHAPSYNSLDPNTNHERGMLATLRSIEACAMLGIKNTVIHSAYSNEYLYPGDRDAYIEANLPFFKALVPHMEKYGVNVLIENSCEANMKGKYFPMTGADMNAFIDALDHPLFGACWDIGHANVQRVNMRDEMVALGKNLKALHIHDNNGYGDQHLPIFEGTLDFDCFMQGIIDSGYDGYFTFEVEAYNPPSLELKKQGLIDLYNNGKYLLEKYKLYEK